MKKIILDLDGVLVDCVGGLLKLHGVNKSVEEFYADHLGKWNVDELLGMPKAKFWAPVDRNFWFNLKPTRDCYEIFDACTARVGTENVYIWTSPILGDGCFDGKRDWVIAHLPVRYSNNQLIVGKAKHLGANKDTMLVDDADHNIAAFLKAGGQVCHVPRLWNRFHALSHEALYYVKEGLKCF